MSEKTILIEFTDDKLPMMNVKFTFKGMFTGRDMFRVEKALWKNYRIYQRGIREANAIRTDLSNQGVVVAPETLCTPINTPLVAEDIEPKISPKEEGK